jgi:hypothetical protein
MSFLPKHGFEHEAESSILSPKAESLQKSDVIAEGL